MIGAMPSFFDGYGGSWKAFLALFGSFLVAGGIALWLCNFLFIVFLYGPSAYFYDGLHVAGCNRLHGLLISNGDRYTGFLYGVYVGGIPLFCYAVVGGVAKANAYWGGNIRFILWAVLSFVSVAAWLSVVRSLS
jgi:hypothetical protein